MHPAFWPFLLGLVPILLARSWRARIVAILFGCGSVGLGVYYVWSIQHSPNQISGVARVGPALIGGLIVAAISALATYFVDKKHGPKSLL
ncbi:MAG TPA: hypothetical protein VFC44_23105 [Candidatus Saccharimonadales bacterium]|nr:hypothetical protein [Candidatus Saccharimonadales bacterium]